MQLPPKSKLTYTLGPYTTHFQSPPTPRRPTRWEARSARPAAGPPNRPLGGHRRRQRGSPAARPPPAHRSLGRRRSEEHTSELQSLMRSSYAVFCLIKKKTRQYSADHMLHLIKHITYAQTMNSH